MSDNRIATTPSRRPGKAAPTPTPEESGNKKKWAIAALALLVLLLVGIYWTFAHARRTGNVAELKALNETMKEKSQRNPENFKKTWELRKDMPLEDQREADRANRETENERLRTFFKKSPQERHKELVEQIKNWEKEMEQRRKEMEQRRKEMEAARAAEGGSGGSGGNARPGGPGGNNPWAKMSNEERQQRRDQRLDAFSPEERALRNQWRMEINQVRQAMGLPIGGGRGGGPRGGFGGGPPGGGPPRIQ
jgi:hypothetical protein